MSNEFDAIVQAALAGAPKRLASLVARGADVDQYDAVGHTPLLRIVFIGDRDAAELLLLHGADPNRSSRDDPTATPLWHARDDFGLHDLADLLVRFGAR